MLFMITQVHTPQACPIDEGGPDVLINKNAEVAILGRWGAWWQHTVYYLVEADSAEAVQRFLEPGEKRCTSTVTPVEERPIAV